MNIQESIKTAFELYLAGKLQRAENIFRQILKIDANNVSAQYFLGIISYDQKHYDLSIDYFKRVIFFEELNF